MQLTFFRRRSDRSPNHALPNIPLTPLRLHARMKKPTVLSLAIVGLALLGAEPLRAVTFTVTSSQNWSGFSPQPTSADAIEVESGATLTVNIANGECASIQLGVAGAGDGALAFQSGSVVTCAGDVIMGQATSPSQSGTITMLSGGTLKIAGSLVFTPGLSALSPGSGT